MKRMDEEALKDILKSPMMKLIVDEWNKPYICKYCGFGFNTPLAFADHYHDLNCIKNQDKMIKLKRSYDKKRQKTRKG